MPGKEWRRVANRTMEENCATTIKMEEKMNGKLEKTKEN